MKNSLENRFNKSYKINPITDCWEWIKYTSPNRYGRIQIPGNPPTRPGAHRVSWEIHNGMIPNDLCVLHKCNNPPCVNPDHLYLGTQKDNHNYRDACGNGPQGSRNGRSKLTDADILFIRNSILSGRELSKLYKVSETLISMIRLNKIWKHLLPQQ